MTTKLMKTGRFLSYVLRHKPESIGLKLDEEGWAVVETLIDCAAKHQKVLNKALIEEVVATNSKQRFRLSDDGLRIRANQGHSINIDLGLAAIKPPPFLYHGTASRFLNAIQKEGLKRGNRHHVHLSADYETAVKVGQRHGKPVVLKIDAAQMHQEKHTFYRSENGVWLTVHVPPKYFTQMAEAETS